MNKFSFILIVIFSFLLNSFRNYAQESEYPTSIILIIANGMGTSQITAAMVANNDTLNLERFNQTGFIKNYYTKNFAPDSKYGTFPIATGRISPDENISDSLKKPWKNIFEIAKEKSKSIGLVTTGEVVSNSLTPFYSHRPYDKDDNKKVIDLLKTNPDVIIGGGKRFFKSPTGIDFISQMESKGYKVIDSYKELKKTSSRKIAGLLSRSEIAKADKRGNYLELAWIRAFKSLVPNKKGYLLVIENPHIEWAAHDNDWRYLTSEIIDFDKMIGMILDYVSPDNKTLVIVVSPYETGGMTINDGNLQYKHINPKWTAKSPTATIVPVFASGPKAELFTGIYSNSQFYLKLKSLIDY